MPLRNIALIVCGLATSGCFLYGVDCTTQFVYGLNVQVQDSISGAWIGAGSTLLVADGSYHETVSWPPENSAMDALPLSGAGERPGVYALTVRRAGYVDCQKAGVRVRSDECHVVPVNIVARLRPLP
jgi:hypothetical protein